MSYSRTFHKSITVHGTVSCSYPASQNGGVKAVPYTHTEPVNITINVNTDPFDSSVMGASKSVDLLTGAVTAMESAQIASIVSNSKTIADKIINGFFHTISTDITTQRTECNSALKTKFALLAEYAKAISDKKNRMESDNAKIKEHYGAIFRSIDKDLNLRIEKLDKESFHLSKVVREKTIQEPEKNGAPFLLLQMIESNQLDGLLTTARIRGKVSNVINSIASYVSKSNEYRKNVSKILECEKIETPKMEYIPAIFYKGTIDDGGQFEFFSPDMKVKYDILDKVEKYAEGMRDGEWNKVDDDELSLIDQSFSKNMEAYYSQNGESYELNQRIAGEIMRMWQDSKNSLKTNHS